MNAGNEIVVVGGGYAGVMAANRLTQRQETAVTLINPRATFVERIRLHQRVAGTHEAEHPYDEVLADRVQLLVGEVTQIDAAAQVVELATGERRGYDYLIYAVGSGSAPMTVPGASEFAVPIATKEDADRLQSRLAGLSSTAPITVVGGGATGIETAAELADVGWAVTLVAGQGFGHYLHPRGRDAVRNQLRRLGVEVLEGAESRVATVLADAVSLTDGRRLTSAATIWTAGFAVPELARNSGLRTDRNGRLLTDETLTSLDSDRIVAAGDSASPSGVPLRMSCQAAEQLGAAAAATILARIEGNQPTPFAIGFVGQCLSLGRERGLVQLSHRNDHARRFHIGGRTGGRIKELICRSTVRQLQLEARKPGLVRIPAIMGDPERRRLRDETSLGFITTRGSLASHR